MGALIAGVDEAGFGPLLGPLTVGFAVLWVEDGSADDPELAASPWKRLAKACTKDVAKAARHLVVADSKKVFARTDRGARRLEDTALAFLAQCTPAMPCGADLVPGRFCRADGIERHPWYGGLRDPLPRHGERGALELAAERLRRTLEEAHVRVLDAGVHALFEQDYNGACDQHGNKSLALWHAALPLVQRVWDLVAGNEGLMVLDRQGGRARYGALLAQGLPGASVRMLFERGEESAYELRGRGDTRRLIVRFQERGEEASFPTALASCLAKYTRELCMDALNGFFARHQAGLAPTAGYTTDGRRWLVEAAPAIASAGLEPSALVRTR